MILRSTALIACLLVLAGCKPPADAPDTGMRAPAPAAPDPGATTPAVADAAKPAEAEPAPKPEIPSLVVDVFDGGKFDLSERRGKWVVVNFWATWCNPCLKEIPDLAALDARRDDVEVIGLAYEEIGAGEMRAFLKKHAVSYPVAILDVYAPPADFETPRGLPMTYLIAPDGKVAKRYLGPVTSEDLLRLIDAAATPAT